MDWSGCHFVERVPGRVSGAWVVMDSRVQADAVVQNALDGFSPEEIVTDIFVGLTIEQVRGVLDYAAQHEAHPV